MGRWVGGISDTGLGTFVFKRWGLYKISEISLIELHFEIVFIVNEICGVCKVNRMTTTRLQMYFSQHFYRAACNADAV